DWFIYAALKGTNDTAVQAARQFFERSIDLTAAQAELDWSRPPSELQDALGATKFEDLRELKPLLSPGGTVSRNDWEKVFAQVVRRLRLGTSVIPLDSPTQADFVPESPVAVELRTESPSAPGKPKYRFAMEDYMVIVLESKSQKPICFE